MIAFEPKTSSLDVSRAARRKSQAIENLSSGRREDLRLRDAGSFSMTERIKGQVTSEHKIAQNIQNLVSLAEVQDGVLKQMGSLVARMTELASLAGNSLQSDEERQMYNKEYIDLVRDFNAMQNQSFNGIDLFGSGFSEEKSQFLNSLKDNWLKASEDLIKQEYGWDPDPSDSWDLIVNVSDTGPYAAFVSASYSLSTGIADVNEMQFDLPDFSPPHTQPTSTADTIVAHEMVHLMQAQNSYYGDLIGDGVTGGSEATWFKEGLAEFIYGADSRSFGILGMSPSDGDIDTLTGAINTGNESWVSSEQYATGYLAVKYLHKKINDAGLSGIKHMTTWMKSQYDGNQGSTNSGINAYFATHGAIGYTDNNDFLSDYKGINGRNFLKNDVIPKLNNTDSGSIQGSDANSGASDVSLRDSVPDTNGSPLGTYIEEDGGTALTIANSWDGQDTTLNSVAPISFNDTSTYNLTTVKSATDTAEYLEGILRTIAGNRASVASNMSVTKNAFQALQTRTLSLEKSISKSQDTVIADETHGISRGDLLLGMCLKANLQARETSASVVLSLLI